MHTPTALLAGKAMLGASLVLGLAVSPHASAEPDTVALTTLTVDGVDYPVCAEEDCSDQPGQVGLWLDDDTGNWYLELGEHCTGQVPAQCELVTYLVVDDTVTLPSFN